MEIWVEYVLEWVFGTYDSLIKLVMNFIRKHGQLLT